MGAIEPSSIASPCVKICQLDEAKVCTGCGRSLDEIAEWMSAGDTRRLEIIGNAHSRIPALRRPPAQEPPT